MQALPRIESGGAGFAASADARAKVVVSVLASLTTIIVNSPEGQFVLFAFSAAYALSIRRPWLLLACYGIVAAMLLLALGCAALVRLVAPAMPDVSVGAMLVPFLRLLVTVNVTLPLAFATRLQSLLGSLKSFRLPFYLYIPLAVMVRFIPTFIADMRQIAEALRIRGFRLSWAQFFRHPILTARFISVPLLFRSLKASEDLGIAAELKGLGAERTFRPYRAPAWHRADTLLVLAALAVAAAAFFCNMTLGAGTGRLH